VIAAVGSAVKVDAEYMTVTDNSDLNNLVVTRASFDSVISVHDAGAIVDIWGA
jgi:hypothetical protein